MKLLLEGLKNITQIADNPPERHSEGWKRLKVLYTAICRTDAKMWANGHRDLRMPRVLGHEIAARDEHSGTLYTIWPGISCNCCFYCRSGRENLCESMEIIGFHKDGGFAEYIDVPVNSLVPVHKKIDPKLLCFAEPIACVVNCLKERRNLTGKKILIYGGGVLGSLAALICTRRGGCVTVLENNEDKIRKTSAFQENAGCEIYKQINRSNFDIAINCCDSFIAFSQAVTKLKKTGELLFFSGLKKNEEIDTNIINLFHYKELELYGSYGPLMKNMQEAVHLCIEEAGALSALIEDVILPDKSTAAFADVLEGKSLKYILDFTAAEKNSSLSKKVASIVQKPKFIQKNETIKQITENIICAGKNLKSEAQKNIDQKTKPLGSLGRLEQLSVQLCCIQNTLHPEVHNKKLLVFAADHGVVEEGVSAYPSKVTAQMVKNFIDGGAAINVFCEQFNIGLKIIDMGIGSDISGSKNFIDKKVAYGTENFALQPAMSIDSVITSLQRGAEVCADAIQDGCDVIGIGEMGIGNTSSATAIISAVTGVSPERLTGRGTGIDDEGMNRKIEVLRRGLTLHKPQKNDPIDILAKVGGFEIAGMCGAILKASELGKAVVLDGLISTSAGLLSYLFTPEVKDYLIVGHKSVERGQMTALEFIGISPVIDLDMRLGEGTGAAIAINLVDLSCKIMCEMATFEEAGISKNNNFQLK